VVSLTLLGFFFSSRRRHTRFSRDWSSDVCSSDLGLLVPGDLAVDNRQLLAALRAAAERAGVEIIQRAVRAVLDDGTRVTGVRTRAEERRVGKACGSSRPPEHGRERAWRRARQQ